VSPFAPLRGSTFAGYERTKTESAPSLSSPSRKGNGLARGGVTLAQFSAHTPHEIPPCFSGSLNGRAAQVTSRQCREIHALAVSPVPGVLGKRRPESHRASAERLLVVPFPRARSPRWPVGSWTFSEPGAHRVLGCAVDHHAAALTRALWAHSLFGGGGRVWSCLAMQKGPRRCSRTGPRGILL